MFEKVSVARALRRLHHYRRQLERTFEPDLGGHGNTGHSFVLRRKMRRVPSIVPTNERGACCFDQLFPRNARDAISRLWMLQTDSAAAANLLLSKPPAPRESAEHHYRQDVGVYGKTFSSLPGELFKRVPRWDVATVTSMGVVNFCFR